MAIDISQLPVPNAIEAISFETILADYKAQLISRYPTDQQAAVVAVLDLESEPMVKLLEVVAYREMTGRSGYNDEAKALLLAYATGADLEHIGVTYYQEEKLLITPADPTAIPPIDAVYESDEAYRSRLALKPESYSTAGPTDAYKFHARSASGLVKDVSVTSPIGGTTVVHVLSSIGNGLPDEALLATVDNALNAETVRPLSEEVLTVGAEILEYTLDLGLVLFPGPEGEIVTNAANQSLLAYSKSAHALGFDIIHSAIDAAAHKNGVKRVIIDSPAAEILCDKGQAPYCIGITVRIVGIEA